MASLGMRLRTYWMIALCVSLVSAFGEPVLAINIDCSYDEESRPSYDPDGVMLMGYARKAARLWEDYFPQSGDYDIEFSWDSSLGSTLGQTQQEFWPWPGYIDMNTNPGADGWWFDPTPTGNSEFDMAQVLYRDITPAEQNAWFNGSPSGLMEVGYRGMTSDPAIANKYDFFSTIVHEIGHALGVGVPIFDYDVYPPFIDWQHNVEIITTADGGGHLRDKMALLAYSSAAPGLRRLPSFVDIVAIADDEDFTSVDLPRKEWMGRFSGAWQEAGNWMGNRVPDEGDAAYIRQGTRVRMFYDTVVFDVHVLDGSTLSPQLQRLNVLNRIVVQDDDPDSFTRAKLQVEHDSDVVAYDVFLRGGMLKLENEPTVTVWHDVVVEEFNGVKGLIEGTGFVDVGGRLINDGRIVSSGGIAFRGDPGSTNWDLDGPNETGTIDALYGPLIFTGRVTDSYDNAVSVGVDSYLNFSQDWTLGSGGALNFYGGTAITHWARIEGNGRARLNGTVTVDGWARISAPVTFGGMVRLPDADDKLFLTNETTFNGATISGAGTIALGALTVVGGVTTSTADIFIWNRDTEIQAGATLDIHAKQISEYPALQGYSANATIAGRLKVVTDTPWKLEGQLLMAGGEVDGSQIDVYGKVTAVSGTSTIFANTTWGLASDITILDGATLRMEGVWNSEFLGTGRVLGTLHSSRGWMVGNHLRMLGGTVAGETMGVKGALSAQTGDNLITARVSFNRPTVTVAADSSLRLEGFASFLGGTYTGDGTLTLAGASTFEEDVTLQLPLVELDGNMTVSEGVRLDVIATNIQPDGVNVFSNRMFLQGGTANIAPASRTKFGDIWLIIPKPWTISSSGSLAMMEAGGYVPVLTGSPITLDGAGGDFDGSATINTTGLTLKGNTRVIMDSLFADPGGNVVTFEPPTTYGGARIEGDGALVQNGDATVTAPVWIDIDRFDMDGDDGATIWNIAGILDLNVSRIGPATGLYSYFTSRMDITSGGCLKIDKTPVSGVPLLMMPGEMNFDNTAMPMGTMLEAGVVIVSGTMNVDGPVGMNASLVLLGTLGTDSVDDVLKLSDTALQMQGGRIVGPGTLQSGSAFVVAGFGEIATAVELASDADLMAAAGVLLCSGEIRQAGLLGTLDETGTLRLTRPLDTGNVQSLQLNGGTVSAADSILNNGTTRGHGTVIAPSFVNDGQIIADGGTLLFDWPLRGRIAVDLDGKGDNGLVEAVDGSVEIRTVAEMMPFAGRLTIQNGHSFTMDAFGLALEGHMTLNGGAYIAPQLLQRGTIITDVAPTELRTDVTFAGESSTQLGADLVILGNAILEDRAIIGGAGRLVVSPKASLVAQGETSLNVRNFGRMDIAGPGGQFRLVSLEQRAGSRLVFDIGATAAGKQFDALRLADTVKIASDTTMEIRIRGGDAAFQAGKYELISAKGGLGGVFTRVTDLGAYTKGDGLTYDEAEGTMTLMLEMDLHPGDANLDGATDVSDRIIWNRFNFTDGTTFVTGDFNGDGATDVSDRIIWNSYNFTVADGASQVTVVPEPASLTLLGLSGVIIMARKRRRK